jgi:hypothetical protein
VSYAQDTRSALRARDPGVRLLPAPATSLVQEFRGLWLLVRDRVSRGARPWLGVALAVATVLVWSFLHFHVLQPELFRSGDVYASLPITSELARLPMSVFLPTAYLPLWAACAQLLVVIGLGEMLLGRWLTIVVALVGHVSATLLARAFLDSGHGHLLGLLPAFSHVLDTGPSAATTAVGACVLVATRMHRSAVLLSIGLFVAAFFMHGVDGVEHVTALVWGVLAGIAVYFVAMRPARSRDTSWEGLRYIRASRLLRRFSVSRSSVTQASDGR